MAQPVTNPALLGVLGILLVQNGGFPDGVGRHQPAQRSSCQHALSELGAGNAQAAPSSSSESTARCFPGRGVHCTEEHALGPSRGVRPGGGGEENARRQRQPRAQGGQSKEPLNPSEPQVLPGVSPTAQPSPTVTEGTKTRGLGVRASGHGARDTAVLRACMLPSESQAGTPHSNDPCRICHRTRMFPQLQAGKEDLPDSSQPLPTPNTLQSDKGTKRHVCDGAFKVPL